MSFIVSDAGFNEYSKQIEDTISFLWSNKKDLQQIRASTDIDFATIDFGVELKIDYKNVHTQSSFFPTELVSLFGELGISIDLYIY